IGGLSARTPTKNPAGAGFSAGSWWRLLAHALELDVHAAVLLAAFRGLVGRNRLRLALADGGDLRGRDALAHQVLLDGHRAALGELLVVGVAADRVRVAGGDHHLEIHALHLGERVIDALAGIRTQDRLVE